MGGLLSGIRVLDLTRVLSGPHAGRVLADLGADVIKVEPPDGDTSRFANPRVNGLAAYYIQQNVGKRSISIDLSRREGTDLFLRLADGCDVLLENFRPGVMKKMGLGYESLEARNPGLIYASISGYGQTGPWSQRRAYAATIAAETGLTKRQGDARGGAYSSDPHSHADAYAGMECVIAVLAALYNRERTGHGDYIDVAMTATMLYVNDLASDQLWDGDVATGAVRSFGTDDFPIITAANGEVVVVAGNPAAPWMFERFITAIAHPELAHDVRFADVAERVRNLADLIEIVGKWAATMPDAASIEGSFEATGLATGRVRSVRELATTAWAADRHAIVEVSDRGGGVVRVPNSPWLFRNADAGVRGDPSYRGEDNREVLRELLGLEDTEIDALHESGVLSSRLPCEADPG